MAVSKNTLTQFTQSWAQRSSVAAAHGIPMSAIIPVLQYDYKSHIANGLYGMSNLEAYAAINAVHSQSVPTPTPVQPHHGILGDIGSFAGHAFGDVQTVATGLFHAGPQLYDLAKGTVGALENAITHPQSVAQGIKGLSFSAPMTPLEEKVIQLVPGEVDVRAAASSQGRQYLSQHPILDLLDLAGASRILRGAASSALDLKPPTNDGIGQVADTPVSKAATAGFSATADEQAGKVGDLLRQLKPIADESFVAKSPHVLPLPDLSQADSQATLYNILNSKSPLTQLARKQLRGGKIDTALQKHLGPQGLWGGKIEQFIRPLNIARRMGQNELNTRIAQIEQSFSHLTPEETRELNTLLTTSTKPDGTFIRYADIASSDISPVVKEAYSSYEQLVGEYQKASQDAGHTAVITNPIDGRQEVVAAGSDAERLIARHDMLGQKYLAAAQQLQSVSNELAEHVEKVTGDGYHLPDGSKTSLTNILNQLRSQLASSDPRSLLDTSGASKEAIRGASKRLGNLLAPDGPFDKLAEAIQSHDIARIKLAIGKLKNATASKFLRSNQSVKLIRNYLDDLANSIRQMDMSSNGSKLAKAQRTATSRAKAVQASLSTIDKKWDRLTADRYEQVIKNIVLGHLTNKADELLAEYKITPEQFSDINDLLLSGELNPVGLAPFIKQSEMAAFKRSALSTYQKMVDQGGRPIWVPKVSEKEVQGYDRIRVGSNTTPSVNAMKKRALNFSYSIENPAVGLTHAWKQLLSRQYTDEYIERHVVPRLRTEHSVAAEAQDAWRAFKEYKESKGEPYAAYDEFYNHNYMDKITRFDPKQFLHADTRLINLYRDKVGYFIDKNDLGLLTNLTKSYQDELTHWYDKATNVFRFAVLGLSPRFAAHIILGGSFLLLGQTGPTVLRFLPDAMRMVKDGNVPEHISSGVSESGITGDLYTPHQFHHLQGGATAGRLFIDAVASRLKLDKAAAIPEAYQGFLHHVSDVQRTMAYLYGKDKSEVEGPKLTQAELDDAERYGLSAYEYEGMKLSNKVLADLDGRTPFERTLIKFLMPFGSWTKHILRYVINFPLDHPLRANFISNLANQAWEEDQSGLPQYLFHLLYLGHPDASGNVSAVDVRQWNPLRDVANYMTLGGFIGTLNPAFQGLFQAMGINSATGTPELYPQLTYNSFYGSNQAGTTPGHTALSILQAYIPEYGVLDHYLKLSSYTKSIAKYDPRAYRDQLFTSLNFPWLPQTFNIDQIYVKQENDRLNELKAFATTALTSGDTSGIDANPDALFPYNGWYFTSSQLKALVNEAGQWDTQHQSTLPASSLLQLPYAPKLPALAPVGG